MGREVLEGLGRGIWLGPPSSQGPPTVPADCPIPHIVQYGAVQCSAVGCSAVQNGTGWCGRRLCRPPVRDMSAATCIFLLQGTVCWLRHALLGPARSRWQEHPAVSLCQYASPGCGCCCRCDRFSASLCGSGSCHSSCYRSTGSHATASDSSGSVVGSGAFMCSAAIITVPLGQLDFPGSRERQWYSLAKAHKCCPGGAAADSWQWAVFPGKRWSGVTCMHPVPSLYTAAHAPSLVHPIAYVRAAAAGHSAMLNHRSSSHPGFHLTRPAHAQPPPNWQLNAP